MRKLLCLGAAFLVLAGLGAFVLGTDGEIGPEALITEADRRFDRWREPFDFDAYEARLLGAIELWEEALGVLPTENVQSRSYVLNRLAQAYFELSSRGRTPPSPVSDSIRRSARRRKPAVSGLRCGVQATLPRSSGTGTRSDSGSTTTR